MKKAPFLLCVILFLLLARPGMDSMSDLGSTGNGWSPSANREPSVNPTMVSDNKTVLFADHKERELKATGTVPFAMLTLMSLFGISFLSNSYQPKGQTKGLIPQVKIQFTD